MNIVGQLAETVYVTVKELYSGLNPATLTGGIDVVVVRQPDGSFQCSPFHVRFGKLGVLRSKEKIVDIEINGESVDLHMKLGDNGEAFFVEQNENMESEVPAHLCTSPIPLDDPEEMTEASSVSGSGTRKKRRRRKRARADSHQREEGVSSSDEQVKEWDKDHSVQDCPDKDNHARQLQASKSVYYSLSEEPLKEDLGVGDVHRHSDGDQSPVDNVFISRPSSPKSDSELLVKKHESSGPLMQWNWGGFPMPRHSERSSVEIQNSGSHFRTIQRQDSFDMGNEPMKNSSRVGHVTLVRPQPRTQSLDLSNYALQTMPLTFDNHYTFTSSTVSDQSKFCPSKEKNDSEFSAHEESIVNIGHVSGINDSADAQTKIDSQAGKEIQDNQIETDVTDNGSIVCAESSNMQQTEQWDLGDPDSALVSEGDSEIDPCVERVEEKGRPAVANLASLKVDAKDNGICEKAADELGNCSEKSHNQEQQDKKKGKRNNHLGPKGIYLDDLTSLDPELAALYFPKSEIENSCPPAVEGGSGSASQSPQSMGALDSGTEYLSDSASSTTEVSMSLCGCVGDTSQITKDKFLEHSVSYQDFVKNPGIIDDPSLVICINSNYYNWAVAAPMILSLTAFQKNLPKSAVESLVKDKMPKKSGRWWFSWRRRDLDNNQPLKKDEEAILPEHPSTVTATLSDAENVAAPNQKAIISSSLSTDTLRTTQCLTQLYRKSLRLTSEQIENLNLREGANKVIFSVTTQYQGTCRCEAAIYLWNWDDRIIISDIDGTITKSDALGHILPQFGKDWTHKDIAKLYHKIHQNGYKFLYCSARAIGMAAITKNYLQWVNDRGTVLPKGPVLLAPSSLFSALHREVIEKKPEVFKIACLGDIRDLFNPKRQPFFAAFGNRTNDAYAYTQVGVINTRIFTVNPKGELIQEMTKGNKSSYSHLGGLVEHFFPALDGSGSIAFVCPEFSSVTYWKEPLPQLDLDTLL
ncbi:phosphatidate phosphatase LPIN2 isoform X2 [Stigmatopora argus]